MAARAPLSSISPYARRGLGCLLAPVASLVFYGAIAVALLTLGIYPFLYLQDLKSSQAYQSALVCAEGRQSDSCRYTIPANVTNVRSSDDQPEFDVLISGKTVTVIRDSGAYRPAEGDNVQLEMWRGQPVRVTGPGGAEMITDQYPQSRLKTDRDVLGIFLFLGAFCLVVAVLVGWFGRGIVFGRFRGMSAPQIFWGFVLGIGLVIVIVPITLVGQASGWLPSGRMGGTVIGLVLVVLIVAGAFVYRLVKARRGQS
jgi:hypothetical protein